MTCVQASKKKMAETDKPELINIKGLEIRPELKTALEKFRMRGLQKDMAAIVLKLDIMTNGGSLPYELLAEDVDDAGDFVPGKFDSGAVLARKQFMHGKVFRHLEEKGGVEYLKEYIHRYEPRFIILSYRIPISDVEFRYPFHILFWQPEGTGKPGMAYSTMLPIVKQLVNAEGEEIKLELDDDDEILLDDDWLCEKLGFTAYKK